MEDQLVKVQRGLKLLTSSHMVLYSSGATSGCDLVSHAFVSGVPGLSRLVKGTLFSDSFSFVAASVAIIARVYDWFFFLAEV